MRTCISIIPLGFTLFSFFFFSLLNRYFVGNILKDKLIKPTEKNTHTRTFDSFKSSSNMVKMTKIIRQKMVKK